MNFAKMKKKRRRWKVQLLAVLSALIVSLIRTDVERESVPHSALPELEAKFDAIRQSCGEYDQGEPEDGAGDDDDDSVVNIAFVSCGGGKSRFEEVSVFLKALVLSAGDGASLNFVVFTDNLEDEVEDLLNVLARKRERVNITVDFQEPVYPDLEVRNI